jgi:hypothetical protein
MDIEKLHNSLNTESHSSIQRSNLIDYLKIAVKTLPEDDNARHDFAYDVAGLLSTNFAKSLDRNDPLEYVLTMAGELEIPADYNEAKWNEFCNLINIL